MKYFYVCLVFVLLSFLNCVNKESNAKSEIDEKSEQTLDITRGDIESFRYNDYVLSSEADEATSAWAEFVEFSNQIEFLKKADITFFKQDEETLKAFLTEFKENIPEELNTNPIKARILVLETRLLKLHNDLTLDNISKNEQLKSIKNLLEAKSNLNFVINKKLEFEANDVGRPEVGEEVLDSLDQ